MNLPSVLRLPESGNRIFGLDALRAFAICSVVLVHGASWISPRFTFLHQHVMRVDGVTIFFVLSGFLIGHILIKMMESRAASFGTLWDFWRRRWIRTIPPYYLVLLMAISLEIRVDIFSIQKYPAYFVFLQNFNWVHPLNYQEAWSLAVEEWFYLLSAPAIIGLCATRVSPKAAVIITALTMLAATTLYRYSYYTHFQPVTLLEWADHFRTIVLLRLDSLMYGVLAAWWAYYYPTSWLKGRIAKFLVSLVALYLLTGPSSAGDFNFFHCVIYLGLYPLAVACSLPLLSSWKRAKGMAADITTHISLISYSMYLLHSSLIHNRLVIPFVQSLALPSPVKSLLGMGLLWGLTLVLATLMYKYVELPVMNMRKRLKNNS
ncbi:acyltransferase family protein [Hymenobacter rubripertinctus]|uniref:Acyltransferase n=1 Tax=Hymenobacter rubripertinctus TaxID=2029981 RepID=A0A418QPS9_9BACT|nr:acyltransferase [Hymenobacter rubripertinctus]RIY07225.1 acyltransferase [Hymenobacter rubripertinctus]